jgi:CheY-like chemotaxis protein
MARMLTRALGEHIRIDQALSPDLPDVFADAAQLETVLLNLVINARDAMPQGGQLTIATTEANVDETTHEVRLPPGPYVAVAVSDTGIGMSPEVAARAFEPFFTTKEAGKGTGLGLSMVYGFARQSGGHVQLASRPGHGTTVTLYLPQAKAAEAASEPGANAQPRGSEDILLVEDDDEVRAATSRMLSGLGYRVVEVADAEAALTLLTATNTLRLLLTDVVLAHGMSGPELAAKAREVRPGLRVLFMSGYVRDTVAFHEQLDRDAHFLAKPFTKEELATTVRLALDEGGG